MNNTYILVPYEKGSLIKSAENKKLKELELSDLRLSRQAKESAFVIAVIELDTIVVLKNRTGHTGVYRLV